MMTAMPMSLPLAAPSDAPPVTEAGPTAPVLPDDAFIVASAARGTLAEQAYARLKAELHEFALLPGDRFSEVELGRRLGISRTPVREALFRLRNEGFLDVESKTGWFVKPIDFDRLDALYDLRVILEDASVTRLCALDRPAPGLDALKAVWLVPAAERLTDARTVGVLDEQFHTTLVEAAGNPEVARVHADVTGRIRIVRRLDFTAATASTPPTPSTPRSCAR